MSYNEYNESDKSDTLKAVAILIGLAVAMIAAWFILPKMFSPPTVDIAPDNNRVNINGAQRKAIDDMDQP